jgi:hypothetical protein
VDLPYLPLVVAGSLRRLMAILMDDVLLSCHPPPVWLLSYTSQ